MNFDREWGIFESIELFVRYFFVDKCGDNILFTATVMKIDRMISRQSVILHGHNNCVNGCRLGNMFECKIGPIDHVPRYICHLNNL